MPVFNLHLFKRREAFRDWWGDIFLSSPPALAFSTAFVPVKALVLILLFMLIPQTKILSPTVRVSLNCILHNSSHVHMAFPLAIYFNSTMYKLHLLCNSNLTTNYLLGPYLYMLFLYSLLVFLFVRLFGFFFRSKTENDWIYSCI